VGWRMRIPCVMNSSPAELRSWRDVLAWGVILGGCVGKVEGARQDVLDAPRRA